MDDLILILEQYGPAWAPAITAIGGVILSVILAAGKIRKAVKTVQQSADDIMDHKDIKQLRSELELERKINQEIMERQDILIDQMTGIQEYYKTLKREEAARDDQDKLSQG